MYVLHYDDSSHYYCFKKITKTYMYVSDFLMAQVTILPDHHVDMIWGVLARVQLEPIFAC